MAAHINILQFGDLVEFYAVFTDLFVVFRRKYFNFIVNFTKTKHLVYL